MGATFGAVHVKNVSVARLAELVQSELEAEGYTLQEPTAAEDDNERRVVVFEEGGWGIVADEEQDCWEGAGESMAEELSEAFETDAVVISVSHSDRAQLARFRKGRRLGGFCVPDDADYDPESGHSVVLAGFLAGLATSWKAGLQLKRGLVADHAFPEQTVDEAAQLIGLPHPHADADLLWHEPPDGARRLCFMPPESDAVGYGNMEWMRPVGEGGEAYDIRVDGADQVSCCVGQPLHSEFAGSVEAFSGQRIEGIVLELSGTGLALLDVQRIEGWNPPFEGASLSKHWMVGLEGSAEERLRAVFLEAHVAPTLMPLDSIENAAGFRRWSTARDTAGANQFHFSLHGVALQPGTGELLVRLLDRGGSPLSANELRIAFDVAPAPRIPVTPGWIQMPSEPDMLEHLIRDASCYGGSSFLCGWLGFDTTWDECSHWILGWASQVASLLARRAALEIGLASAGTHPKVLAHFGPDDQLGEAERFALVPSTLAREGAVKLESPEDYSCVQLRHQPRGTTILAPEVRAQFTPPPIVPVDLSFAFSRPDSSDERQAIGELVDRLFHDAAARPDCVGGFVAPQGSATCRDAYPYERITNAGHLAEKLHVVRQHVRCPGWRVVVPRPAVAMLAQHEDVARIESAAGVLLQSSAADPFAMSDSEREAMECTVVGCLPRVR